MTPTDTRLSRKNVTLPCFRHQHPLRYISGVQPAANRILCRRHIRILLLRRARCRPYISIRGIAHLPAGKGCTEYVQDRPVSAGGDPWTHPQMPLRLSVPSTTTTIISNIAWLSCNDVMLGGANGAWMAGYRRELPEILEIDWEARPRCGTQSSKEERRRENRRSPLVGAPNSDSRIG